MLFAKMGAKAQWKYIGPTVPSEGDSVRARMLAVDARGDAGDWMTVKATLRADRFVVACPD